MKFERIPAEQGEGWMLAHSLKVLGRKWKKGKLLNRQDVQILVHEGFESIVAAKLEETDVDEDAAAEALARAIAGDGVEIRRPATGRCNLYATTKGLLKLRTDQIHKINSVDEAFTVASLPPYSSVYPGQLIVSIKIIPFAVSRESLNQCVSMAMFGMPPVNVLAYKSMSIGLIQTQTPWFKSSLLKKGASMLQERARVLGSEIEFEEICAHHEKDITAAVVRSLKKKPDLLLLLGASAIQDREDVIPKGIVNAGGRVEHFGMPVDPGNLLLLARYENTRILGLPGCVRSPKRNGFDFVIERLAAGVEVASDDIQSMGTFGILTEPPRRPVRRTPVKTDSRATARRQIYAIVLAAGQSLRMGSENKLFLKLGKRSVIQKVIANLEQSNIDGILVVTGHERDKVRKELQGRAVQFVNNPEYKRGLSTSLRTALAALPKDVSGVLVCLGDMPFVDGRQINKLINAYDPVRERSICVPTYQGKFGNPVLWDKRYFQEMMEVQGDVGAKHIIGDYQQYAVEVEVDDASVIQDIDTPFAYADLVTNDA